MVLQSMIAFIKEQTERLRFRDDCEFAYTVRKYAKFLEQILELRMFVPCKLVDGVWVIFEEPKVTGSNWFRWKEAKERCLFKGFEICIGNKAVSDKNGCIILIHGNGNYSTSGKQIITIEDLVKYNFQLTETAEKQIGLCL